MAVGGAETFLCSDLPTGECSKPMKKMLHKIYKKCKDVKGSDTPCPLTCGTDSEYKEESAEIALALDFNNPNALAEMAAKLLADLLAMMPQSGAD
jgi:hypothetical protein